MKNVILILGGLVVLVAVAVAAWFLVSPLFINNVVDEEFPAAVATVPKEQAAPAEEAQTAQETAAAMPDKVMDDPMPADAAPQLLASGRFTEIDRVHRGSGSATIYRLPDGRPVLRFDDFEVTNGPDLHVLLVEHPNPTNRSHVMEGYIDLGSLKGNIGSQNYDIPANIDLSKYSTVMIYCMPFHVIFSTASLG